LQIRLVGPLRLELGEDDIALVIVVVVVVGANE
jgi:hypothetical protein